MLLVRRLDGKKVVTSDAKVIGEVGGPYAELDGWDITHLAVELNDEAIELFGYNKPRPRFLGTVSVCLPVNSVNSVGDIISLNKTFEELPSLPIDRCNA
jgi:sporulation protein YlmC with PRC-barrel domain